MMQVVQVGMGWFPDEPGGLSRMTYHLAHALPGAGVRVRHLVTGAPGADPHGAGCVRAFARADASLARRLVGARTAVRAALADGAVDRAAAHFALYAIPWLDLVRSRPLVVHFHGPWASEALVEQASGLKVRLQRAVERVVFHRADAFIVLSDAFRRLLHTRYGVPLDRIHIVPGGVDARAFDVAATREEARRALGIDARGPVLVSVRRLARRMGLEGLIDALPALRRAHPGIRLVVAGTGPLEGELRQRIADRGLEACVTLRGFVPEAQLPLLYRAADLSVVPTLALEGFGLVTIESLAAGTPAVVTPVGGLPEIVRPLDARLVASGTSRDALERVLLDALAAGPGLPGTARCQTYVRQRYDWPRIAEQTAAVYAEVLARRGER